MEAWVSAAYSGALCKELFLQKSSSARIKAASHRAPTRLKEDDAIQAATPVCG